MDIFEKYTPELEGLAQPIFMKGNNVYEVYMNIRNKIVGGVGIQGILQAILEKNETISPIKTKPVIHTTYDGESNKSNKTPELITELNPEKSRDFFKAKIK